MAQYHRKRWHNCDRFIHDIENETHQSAELFNLTTNDHEFVDSVVLTNYPYSKIHRILANSNGYYGISRLAVWKIDLTGEFDYVFQLPLINQSPVYNFYYSFIHTTETGIRYLGYEKINDNDNFVKRAVIDFNFDLEVQNSWVESNELQGRWNAIAISPTGCFTYGGATFPVSDFSNGFIEHHCRGDVSIASNEILEFIIYPNPASSEIYIDIPLSVELDLQIVSLTGQIMQTAKLKSEYKSFKIDLPTGLYYVNLFNDGQLIGVKKLIVN